MAFTISQMIVDNVGSVVALDWVYNNEDGQMSHQWRLQEPYGDTPLEQVTETVAVGWLEEQLPNTAEDFDKAIAARKEEVEYAATLKPYVKTESGNFEAVPEPEPEPAPEVSNKLPRPERPQRPSGEQAQAMDL
tara:strand:+ start:883 stop:1284 length:402 start_codon:yes stop_codon:yes gene_type:complete